MIASTSSGVMTTTMSASSSSSDSEASSSSDEAPKVTTHTERVIRRYHIKRSLILDRIFAIEQDNDNLVNRISEVEDLVRDGICHRKTIMARLDTYGDDYRSVPVVIPSEAEAASAVRATQPSIMVDKKNGKGGKKRKLVDPKAAAVPNPAPEEPTSNKRPNRDPSLPKRPHNAFFYFCQERRPGMQKEFPNMNKKEIAAMLSQKWNEVSHPEKEIYIQLQNERKRQYQAIMARYNEYKESPASS